MHVNLFDHFRERQSLIHHLDPRVKVVVTLAFILTLVLLPDGVWTAYALAWGLILGLNRLARLPWYHTLRRSFVALPFAMAAVSVVFTIPGDPVTTINAGPLQLTATDAGLVRFTSILIRSWLSVQAAILLTAATPFADLLHAFRHLRVPKTLVAVIAFMYRYLFVLGDETHRLLRARSARSAQQTDRPSGGSIFWRARVAGSMAGQLFLRSFERSDRVYNAMLARGYRGEFMTLNPHHLRPADYGLGALALVILGCLFIFGKILIP